MFFFAEDCVQNARNVNADVPGLSISHERENIPNYSFKQLMRDRFRPELSSFHGYSDPDCLKVVKYTENGREEGLISFSQSECEIETLTETLEV